VTRAKPNGLLPAEVPPAPAVRILAVLGPFLALVVVVLVGGLVEYAKEGSLNYWAPQNQCLILTQTVTVAIGAVGMTLVIISGGIDLSAGSAIALTAVTAAWVVHHYAPDAGALTGSQAFHLPLLAALVALAVGALVGAANGGLVTALRLPPFIITLGMMTFARGTAKWLASEQKIDAPMNWISDFTSPRLALFRLDLAAGPLKWTGPVAISAAVVVTLLLAAAIGVLLRYTRLGRHIFAIGSSEPTARLCGVRVERTKWLIYAMAGAMFGLAGVTDFGRLSVGDPTTAIGKELDIIAAVVIGGGSLAGGSGSVLGSLLGALLMAHLRNLCVHLGLPNFVQEQVVGAVIVVAVALDSLRHRRRD